MVCAYMSAKPFSVEIVNQRRLEGLHELRERTLVGLDGERGLDAVADARGQLGQALGELLRGGDRPRGGAG